MKLSNHCIQYLNFLLSMLMAKQFCKSKSDMHGMRKNVYESHQSGSDGQMSVDYCVFNQKGLESVS